MGHPVKDRPLFASQQTVRCARSTASLTCDNRAMRILPVLDLKGGRIVRAIAGQRHQYQPVVSRLTDKTDPLAVAEAFRDYFGFEEIYLADLDAISSPESELGRYDDPALGAYLELVRHGFRLWVDAGRWIAGRWSGYN